MTTFRLQESLFITMIPCAACGMVFGIPSDFERNLRQKAQGFFCPNGHSLMFGQSEVENLRKELARERQLRDQAEALARDKGAECERLAVRVACGVCPCCERTFANLARHMKTKHPEAVPAPRPAIEKKRRRRRAK